METKELVAKCIDRGILVTEEMLKDHHLLLDALKEEPYTVHTLKNYTKQPTKRTVQDFVRLYNHRYTALRNILRERKELDSVVSIGRLQGKRERETVQLIGMVLSKSQTKNGHVVLTLEDPSGTIDVWVMHDNRELQRRVQEVVLDEVIGVVGQTSNGRVFAQTLLSPDIPNRELKRAGRDVYAVFIGDVEIGSNLFMEQEFRQMLAWLRGEVGNDEQREIARKTGYVVFIGDLVHGVGIYPGQQQDSSIHDIKVQYAAFTELVKEIPTHIQVILIPGNHDAVRLQEPQPPVYEDLAPELYSLKNVHILSNPTMVTLDRTTTNPGIDVLLYHGYSLIYYAKEVQPIKDAGGLKATDEIMRLLLQKRHLAVTHGSNTYVPDPDEDPLLIEKVPDVLVTGHTHNICVGAYHSVQVINAGCWNDVSDEQKKRGLEPDPARLPVLNLKTRDIRIVNFYPE